MTENIEINHDTDIIINKTAYRKLLNRVKNLIKEITFWQGKFNILRIENNSLRKQMKNLVSINEVIDLLIKADTKMLKEDGLEISEEILRKHYSDIFKVRSNYEN